MSFYYLCVGTVESKAHYLIILSQPSLGKENIAKFFHQPHNRKAMTNWGRATMTQFQGPVTSETFKNYSAGWWNIDRLLSLKLY